MAFRTMYPPQKDSPSTFLLGDISAVDTLMTVSSAAALPQTLPYPLTLGIDKTLTETVMVTAQNLENNQLTITRGTPAYAWVAGSKAARVLRATDFLDIQDNLRDVDTRLTTTQGTVSTHGTDISTLKTTVGGPTSGLVKGLADEITRATGAENAEVTRATNAETNLNTIKVNRSELAQVITDWVYSADGTKVEVQITRYNASTQQTTQYTRTLPVVSDDAMGVMTPEAYAEITALRNDVNSLINLGGRFIGVSFATKAVLNEYSVPASVKTKDFTYVLDDETKSGATTRYVWNGSTWEFTFVIEHDPVGLATSSTPGLVKSDSGSTDGKVFVEVDGTMSVIGWNSVFNADNHVSGTTNKVFTATEQTKLDGIAAGAEKNVNADFNATSGDAQILNLPSTFPPSVHGHAITDVTDLAEILADKVTGLMAYTILHVAKTGSDLTGDGSEAKPYLTIQKAIGALPKYLGDSAQIMVHAGAYDEIPILYRFSGPRFLSIQSVEGETVSIKALYAQEVQCILEFLNLTITGEHANDCSSIQLTRCNRVHINGVTCVQPISTTLVWYGSIFASYCHSVYIQNTVISNKQIAVDSMGSTVYLNNTVTGANNVTAIRCGSGWGSCGGYVQKGGATIAGVESTAFSGQIF